MVDGEGYGSVTSSSVSSLGADGQMQRRRVVETLRSRDLMERISKSRQKLTKGKIQTTIKTAKRAEGLIAR